MSVIQMLMSWNGYVAGTQTFITPGSATWLCPAGVYSVTAECWGAGGGGGGYPNGAAGGGYVRGVISNINPGTSYAITVGTGGTPSVSGTDSWFSSSTTILAYGGVNGSVVPSTGRSGIGAGTIISYAGGSGHQVLRYVELPFDCDPPPGDFDEQHWSGGAGGGAGSTAAGVSAVSSDGAAGGAGGGGNGGNGGYRVVDRSCGSPTVIADFAGNAGSSIGGGGGGAPPGGVVVAGTGARGQVRLTW